jgi:putative ABC transport system permease protein
MTLLRYSIRNIAATRIRFALTTLAVVIGVALTVGVLINTDGLRAAFSDLASDLYDQVDLSVRSQSTLDKADQWQDLPLLDPSLKDRLEAIVGVEKTAGAVSEFNIVAIGADGEATDPELSQQGGMGWPEDESLGRIFPLDDGVSRQPAGPDEFAMDHHTAATFGFQIGERYKVATPTGTHPFELVGVFYFMEPDFQAPFQLVAWDMDTARDVLHDGGGYDLIDVRLSPGASLGEVTASIERELGPAYVVLSQQEQVEARDQEMSDLLEVFRSALLAFAVIVLVISAFITYNTFTLVTGQRIREFGLLRVLGADRRQVASTVAFEALVMGAVAAVVGFGLGIGVSEALSGILSAAGSNLPATELTVGAGPIIAALALGIGLTVVVSLLPAMWARRVTPMVALADNAGIDPYSRRRSIVIGSVVGTAGLVLMVVGLLVELATSALILLLGFGALGMLVGVNICSPAVAGPMSQVLGWPAARAFRLNGRLAQLNAVRNPRRTATTASALMIGLAMVSLVTVLGSSFKETLDGQLEDSVRADWLLCAGPCDNQQLVFSSEAGSEIGRLPELESVEVFRFRPNGVRTAEGVQHVLSAANLASFSSHVEPNVTSGSVAGAGPGDVMVHVDAAEESGLVVGDEVRLEISGHEEAVFEVVALHTEDSVVGSWVIDLGDWDRYVVGDQDSLVTAVTAPGVSRADARAALEAGLAEFPQVEVRDQAEYRASRSTQVDNLLVVINVFLIMALVIAVMGFSNTMALSVFERTREIGLLRAVGMGKRQIRTAILLEGVIVAVFGGVIGVVTGLVAGSIASGSLPGDIISTVALPGGAVVVYLVVSAVAGLLASLAPARRANRIDLLEAISYH